MLLFFGAWTRTQTGGLIGLEAFRTAAAAGAIAGAGAFLLLIAGAAGWGLQGAVIGLVGGSALTALVNHFGLRRAMEHAGVPVVLAFPKQELAVIWRFSMPALLGSLVWMPSNWAANAMLANTPGGYAQLGLLGVATQWFALLMFLPGGLTSVLLPIFAERIGASVRAEANRVAVVAVTAIVIGMAPAIALVALMSPAIMAYYGDAYRGGAPALILMALAAAAAAPQGVLENYIAARDRMWARFVLNLLWGAIAVSGAALLVDRGAAGVAAAMLCAYAIRIVATFLYFRVLSGKAA